jgi:CHAD domain-containing protein
MAEGKWIDGLHGHLPALEAARLVLAARLATVHDYLPLALHHAEETEFVHQLRVATRRADAALKLFRDHLPDADFKAARKRLRSIRRAAGAARDWDVFALEVTERLHTRPEKERAGLDCLFGLAQGRRASAQDGLAAIEDDEGCHFEKLVTHTIARIHPAARVAERQWFLDLARPMLCLQRDGLHGAASSDLSSYENLHQVRIAGKRLRYAMEIFGDCFAAPFKDELYPQIEAMQEILGRANDSHVAGRRLIEIRQRLTTTWREEWPRLKPGIESLLRFHQRRLPQERKRFLGWWKKWHDAGETLFDSLVV